MLVAVAAFSFMDATLKLFSQHYPPMEIAFLRGLASLPFMALPALVKGRYRDLKPNRIWMHLLRGVLMVIMLGGFIYAVRTLSLASAYSIFLAEPLIVTALAVPLLGDRVGWRNWIAISVGLVGVVVMLRPSASSLVTLGALAAFVSATAYALSVITVASDYAHGHDYECDRLDGGSDDPDDRAPRRSRLGAPGTGALEVAAGARRVRCHWPTSVDRSVPCRATFGRGAV